MSHLRDDLVCIAVISGQGMSVRKVDVMVVVEPAFCHCRLTMLSEQCVQMVFLHPTLNGLAGLFNVGEPH